MIANHRPALFFSRVFTMHVRISFATGAYVLGMDERRPTRGRLTHGKVSTSCPKRCYAGGRYKCRCTVSDRQRALCHLMDGGTTLLILKSDREKLAASLIKTGMLIVLSADDSHFVDGGARVSVRKLAAAMIDAGIDFCRVEAFIGQKEDSAEAAEYLARNFRFRGNLRSQMQIDVGVDLCADEVHTRFEHVAVFNRGGDLGMRVWDAERGTDEEMEWVRCCHTLSWSLLELLVCLRFLNDSCQPPKVFIQIATQMQVQRATQPLIQVQAQRGESGFQTVAYPTGHDFCMPPEALSNLTGDSSSLMGNGTVYFFENDDEGEPSDINTFYVGAGLLTRGRKVQVDLLKVYARGGYHMNNHLLQATGYVVPMLESTSHTMYCTLGCLFIIVSMFDHESYNEYFGHSGPLLGRGTLPLPRRCTHTRWP